MLYHISGKHSSIAMPLAALCFFFLNPDCRGQALTDTLQEVNIRNRKLPHRSADERINTFAPGQKVKTIDSITLEQYKMQTVASLLSQQTPVFVKSYGLNGLATLNIRGASAAQSQVFWNGVPVTNAAMGIADVSLFPVSMINKLHIVYGSSAALWGSGNVGGALLLESDQPSFDGKPDYDIALGMGSFGQYQLGARLGLSTGKWFSGTGIFAQTAANNFMYEDDLGQRKETRNALLNGIAVQQQFAFRPDGRNVFRFIGWYQDYYREIPAASFEDYSVKNRDDGSLRLLLDWNRRTASSLVYVRTSFIKDEMQYRDAAAMQRSENSSSQYFIEAGWKRKIAGRHQLLLFTPVQVSMMQRMDDAKHQSRYALAGAYRYSDLKERFTAALNLRAERIDHRSVFLPGINASYAVTGFLKLRANIQKTFRAPALNELYYEPGGNEDLKPEQGWSSDIGYRVETKAGKDISLLHDVSVFNRVIDDWIIWLGGTIWTPRNIASVHSRGVEIENFCSLPWRKWKFHLGLNGSYTLATTISSYIPDDDSYGKQIPYTPRYSGQGNAGFTYRSLYFNYNHTYTGVRYVNVDESEQVDAFHTANVQLSYKTGIRSRSLTFTVQINNIYNDPYVVVRARPMPGVNWLFSLRLASL